MDNLELLILQTLVNCEPHAMPKRSLFSNVRLLATKQVLSSEFEKALEAVDGSGEALGTRNKDVPGGSRWKISDAGKLRVQEAGG